MQEGGLIVDRARSFQGLLAEHMANEGCTFEVAAEASPSQLASVERAGGTWKSMLRSWCGLNKWLEEMMFYWQLVL